MGGSAARHGTVHSAQCWGGGARTLIAESHATRRPPCHLDPQPYRTLPQGRHHRWASQRWVAVGTAVAWLGVPHLRQRQRQRWHVAYPPRPPHPVLPGRRRARRQMPVPRPLRRSQEMPPTCPQYRTGYHPAPLRARQPWRCARSQPQSCATVTPWWGGEPGVRATVPRTRPGVVMGTPPAWAAAGPNTTAAAAVGAGVCASCSVAVTTAQACLCPRNKHPPTGTPHTVALAPQCAATS